MSGTWSGKNTSEGEFEVAPGLLANSLETTVEENCPLREVIRKSKTPGGMSTSKVPDQIEVILGSYRDNMSAENQ